jgi:hypothetical protein
MSTGVLPETIMQKESVQKKEAEEVLHVVSEGDPTAKIVIVKEENNGSEEVNRCN